MAFLQEKTPHSCDVAIFLKHVPVASHDITNCPIKLFFSKLTFDVMTGRWNDSPSPLEEVAVRSTALLVD